MQIKIDDNVSNFIESLEDPTIAKVLRTIDLLEKFGHALSLPHSKPLGKGLFELRIRGEQDVRIFYAFHEAGAVLLHAFIKKSSHTPQKELAAAKQKMKALT
jgi:phage-related protein